MALLIDGYNLLHVTGIFGLCREDDNRRVQRRDMQNRGPGNFQRSREALLRFLAASIRPSDIARTTIVFDATEAPPGLPRKTMCDGMTVLYAAGYADADTLIEELIQKETAPRSLLVVSSDHRIQRAARRRRAKYVDSDRWYAELWQRRHAQNEKSGEPQDKPTSALSTAEVEYWLREFSQTPEMQDPPDADLPESDTDSAHSDNANLANPFPPGYGEDLLREGD